MDKNSNEIQVLIHQDFMVSLLFSCFVASTFAVVGACGGLTSLVF